MPRIAPGSGWIKLNRAVWEHPDGQQAVGAFCAEHSDALKNLSDRLAELEETEGGRT